MISVGIVGGTGYTGVELLRLLLRHPQAQVRVLTSRTEAGKRSHHAQRGLERARLRRSLRPQQGRNRIHDQGCRKVCRVRRQEARVDRGRQFG